MNRLLLLLIFTLFSCSGIPELKEPIFTKSIDELSIELGKLGGSESISFNTTAKQVDDFKPRHELDVKLWNSHIPKLSDSTLQSIAKTAAIIVRKSVKNIGDYQFVTVVFDGQINNAAIPSSVKTIFVFSPDELR